MRPFISAAALLVKVTARMRAGSTFRFAIRCATAAVSEQDRGF
jgi:fructose-1-phosphate kinase PfkB-like protein